MNSLVYKNELEDCFFKIYFVYCSYEITTITIYNFSIY